MPFVSVWLAGLKSDWHIESNFLISVVSVMVAATFTGNVGSHSLAGGCLDW